MEYLLGKTRTSKDSQKIMAEIDPIQPMYYMTNDMQTTHLRMALVRSDVCGCLGA